MIECYKVGLFWHGITHDMSKFLPSEFCGYAENFFSSDTSLLTARAIRKHGVHCAEQVPIGYLPEDKFNKAWLLHQHRNKHHWDYWVNSGGKQIPMPIKYVKQMICDWRAMGKVFGDTAESFYHKKSKDMKIHDITRNRIEAILYK